MSEVNVKKAYVDIVKLLEANANKKVSTILPQIMEMVTSKGGSGVGSTFKKDEEGNVTHVFCYYHKEWEAIDEVPYGKKANTATGLNTMCKEGVSNWGKQQRIAKKAKDDLLLRVAEGEEINLQEALEAIEEARTTIIPLGE